MAADALASFYHRIDKRIRVIKMNRAPGDGAVAVLAFFAGLQMRARLAGRLHAVMAFDAAIHHASVIEHADLPVYRAVTLAAVIR